MKKLILVLGLMTAFYTQDAQAQAFYRTSAAAGMEDTRIVNLFPNPAINNTTVVLGYMPDQRIFIDVVDFNGQVRRSYAFLPGGRQFSFDISFLERGYYVIRVREASRLIDMVKFVKG